MADQTVSYRFATTEYIEQLVELRISMQTEVNDLPHGFHLEEYKEKVRLFFRRAFKNKGHACAVAVVDLKIIGMAGVCFYEKPPSISGGSGLVGYVTSVYTKENFRKLGIGTGMMRKLNELAKELNADKLHLGATEDGLSIYKAVGYHEPRFVNLEIRNPFESKRF